ncbi:MAG: LPXTG cell wall anchor domain-containing protein [Actinobacteria bacterium]|jgi:LPXTG-motif cell wall-anchored protein|uniref:Unannotated protein n=1 Tax=freshwater metagenome TaxID=449393 RepID=A0A6J6G8R4_9ZZZZ|nr:LPXTG cell wall anchor domain-containing protein [Actinomycetota bacterium]
MKKALSRTAIGAAVAVALAFGASPAQALVDVDNTNEIWEVCDASDGSVTWTLSGVTAGDLLVYHFQEFTTVSDYSTAYLPTSIQAGAAADGPLTISVADAAALATQAGITEWPIEMIAVVYPSGTTDFNYETNNTILGSSYAAFGIKYIVATTSYEACPKPAAAEAPLPDTGANSSLIGAFSGIAAGLLVAGALALRAVRRRSVLD